MKARDPVPDKRVVRFRISNCLNGACSPTRTLRWRIATSNCARCLRPKGFEDSLEDTVLVERIREVRALLGYTRLESNADFAEITALEDLRISPISRTPPTWLPASEVRGEGIFLRLKEEALQSWESTKEVQQLRLDFLESHKLWRKLRKLTPTHDGFPGIRLVLLHSLAHALIRQIVLDCGYNSASLRERLYSRWGSDHGGPMAGILIYTAAPDSEGTLGGLVELVNPASMGRHFSRRWRTCACALLTLCVQNTALQATGAASTVRVVMPVSSPRRPLASEEIAIWIERSWWAHLQVARRRSLNHFDESRFKSSN